MSVQNTSKFLAQIQENLVFGGLGELGTHFSIVLKDIRILCSVASQRESRRAFSLAVFAFRYRKGEGPAPSKTGWTPSCGWTLVKMSYQFGTGGRSVQENTSPGSGSIQ
jgi:hypothetical protein